MSRTLGVADSKADIDEGSIDGVTKFGTAASATVGFFGVAKVAQPTTVASVTTTGADSTTNAYGYTTAAQANAIVTTVNSILSRLKDLGLIAT